MSLVANLDADASCISPNVVSRTAAWLLAEAGRQTQRGHDRLARECLDRAVREEPSPTVRHARAVGLWNLGLASAAKQAFAELLDVAESSGDSRLLETAAHNLAVLYLEADDPAAAAHFLRVSQAAGVSAGPCDRGDMMATAGRVALEAGDVRRGEEHLGQALLHYLSTGAEDEAAGVWTDLAAAAWQRGDWAETLSAARWAARTHGRTGDRRGLAAACFLLAQAVLLTGRVRTARRLTEWAAEAWDRAGRHASAQQVRTWSRENLASTPRHSAVPTKKGASPLP